SGAESGLAPLNLRAPPHRLRCLVRRLARHALPFRCDAGRDALDEDGVGHAPGTLLEPSARHGALEFLIRHCASPTPSRDTARNLRAIPSRPDDVPPPHRVPPRPMAPAAGARDL